MKKILIGLFILICLLGISAIFVNSYLKNQLQEVIENDLPASITLTYDDLIIDSWGGHAQMKNAYVSLKSRDSVAGSRVENATVKLEGFNHWDYFKNGNINFREISIHADTLLYYPFKGKKPKADSNTSTDSIENPINAKNLDRSFNIERFDLVTEFIQIQDASTDSLLLKTAHFSLHLENITPTITETITRPFNYKRIAVSSDSLYYKLSEFDVLKIARIDWDGTELSLNDLELKTVLSRSELSKQLTTERDHNTLFIKKLTIDSLRYGHNANEKLYFDAAALQLINPDFQVYRDKRLPDSQEFKSLYSRKLRELNFDLMVDSVLIKDGKITYEEKVKTTTQAGKLIFSNIDASITNLGNTYALGTKKTQIAIDALFMNQGPLHLDWEFDVQNTNDAFSVRGSVKNLPVDKLDSFTEPNLGVSMEGTLHETFFTIDGGNLSSRISMKMKYDDYKVQIINQEKQKKKWLTSTLANLLISKTSKREDTGFKEGQGEVTRDTTKSFFNYLWLNLKEGMLKAMTLLD